mgnify:CR=1 FL=1
MSLLSQICFESLKILSPYLNSLEWVFEDNLIDYSTALSIMEYRAEEVFLNKKPLKINGAKSMSEKRLSILESIKQKLKRFDNKPSENKSFEKNDLEDDFNYNIQESPQKQELIKNQEDLKTNSKLENIKEETKNRII